MYTKIKVFIDFIFAVLGLLLLSPIFVFITILLYLDFKESPFFFQRRVGKNNAVFSIVKFKTMKNTRDQKGNLLPDEQRLTKLGTLIRKTSLDEIPQLINVLKGEMSFVGPRPLLTDYIHLYNPIQIRRHEVKPGITGWVQVNGRNAVDWEKKFELDVWYVSHISFWLDFKILLLTVKKVLKSEGISSANSATMEPFRGSANLLVFGAGGHAKVVVDCIEQEGKYFIKELLDDAIINQFIGDYKINLRERANDYPSFSAIVAIGNPIHRKQVVQQLKSNFIMTIHPSAVVSKHAQLGEGCQVFATAVINAGATIGNHCIINTGAIIEHDCEINDYVHVAPNATLGGNVKVGAKTHIGIGATIIQNVTIGKNVIIGAGAVVLDDIPDNCTAVGIPAKPIKFH